MIKLDIAHKKFIDQLKSEGKTASTVVAYSKDLLQLNEHLLKEGVALVSDIQLNHVENFMKGLADQSYSPKSISRKTNATRTYLKFLHKNGHMTVSLAEMLKHPKLDSKAPRILNKMEYRALRDVAREDVRSFAMVEVLLQTGVTISEIADIKMADVEIKEELGNMFVPKRNAKESRNVPLNKAVIEAIKKYLETERPTVEDSKHLFITKTGKPLLVRNIRSTIDRYFKAAGVEKARVNDLRHTFVAHHLAAGVSILYLSKVAGHKRLSTTEKYLKYIERVSVVEKAELGVL